MNRSILLVAALTLLMPFFCLVGCGGGGEEPTQQKIEESRQKLIDRSERMRQDTQKN